MTLTLKLKPEDQARLNQLAAREGCDAECFVQRLVADRLGAEPAPSNTRRMSDDELEARLRAAGVRPGNGEDVAELLRSWIGVDRDPDSTVEEYEQIYRNVENGGIELHRSDV